jgi:hypothetical protein
MFQIIGYSPFRAIPRVSRPLSSSDHCAARGGTYLTGSPGDRSHLIPAGLMGSLACPFDKLRTSPEPSLS